ncbi:MAG: pyridoxamine kinase [Lachnospiraceae bacterium]|nr:pyridoxamine kinase [Lachnospiraceae bacterium]
MSKIVSVQDISCYGQCSLTVALPVLSAYGVETAILPSGILSTHTGGFTGFTFLDLTEEMAKIIDHWKKENITFDGIYTGYIGDARQFDMIKDMRSMLNPGGKLYVDPAMADHGKLYPALGPEIVEGMKSLVREADIILPNITEAAFLLGEDYREDMKRDEYIEMVKRLADLGPETVILTGVSTDPTNIGAMSYVKSTGDITEYYAQRQEKSYHGTGDIFSSLLIGKLLNGSSMYDTIKDSCDFIVECIKETDSDPNHPYGVKFEKVLARNR